MKRKLGSDITKVLKKRIDALKASNNIGIFMNTGLGKPHHLNGDLRGYIGISLTSNYRLIIKPKCDSLSADSLKLCNIVIMKGVDDYHGSKNNWIIP